MEINRYAGESLIWGIDYYTRFNEETNSVFWCQYKNDDYRLLLDPFGKINLGLPKEKHVLTGNPTGFNRFIGKSEYSEREISFSTYFAREKDVSVISRRRDFLIDYFTFKEDKKLFFFLFKPHLMKSYRVEVRPQITGEKYSNLAVTTDITVTLLCKSVFLEAADWSVVAKEVTDQSVQEVEAVNNGFETSFILEIVPKVELNRFQLTHESGAGFRVETPSLFYPEQKIEIDTGTGEITIAGVIQSLSFSKGATFNLKAGSQKLFFQGDAAEVIVKYKEKVK